MRPIVGLDLSLTCTGWAVYASGTLTSGQIKPKGIKGATRRGWVAKQVRDLVGAVEGEAPLVIAEAVPTHGAYNIVPLGELHGVVRDRLVPRGHRPAYLDPRTLKKWAVGNGNAKKALLLPAAQEHLGYTGKSPDEADARWLATVGRQLLGDTGPLFTAQRASLLAAVSWPEDMPTWLGGPA